MENIVWSEELSVGIKSIDSEHKKLISMVNELNHLVLVGDRIAAAGTALSALVEYTVVHFQNEENLMKKFAYPDYEKHRDEHEKLKARVMEFQSRLSSGKAGFTIELIKFLHDWLVNHIRGTDMAYRKFFIEKGVV